MKRKRLKIASKTCWRCGQLISWEKKIHKSFPVHVDKEGFIIGDGDCPEFKKYSKLRRKASLEEYLQLDDDDRKTLNALNKRLKQHIYYNDYFEDFLIGWDEEDFEGYYQKEILISFFAILTKLNIIIT
ncbi:MAG: hypothetical protein ACXABO_14355 [Promethearchaeota archaeon]|jgi:hypothetical protein